MEEAEVLSNRIGIIVKGELKCLGSQFKLKKVYGKAFKLVINLSNIEQEFNYENNCRNCENFVREIFKNTIIFQV